MPTLITGPDGQPRCGWCADHAAMTDYHDREWGFPVVDDRRLFEKLCLESFQSGLSWRTILEKRDAFRTAFDQFDYARIAHYGEADITRLLANPGIVRHRGKIEAVCNNARRAQELIAEQGSLARFFWQYAPTSAEIAAHPPQSRSQSAQSVALSKALKARGWKFVGPTTLFAFMQAMGMVNDHLEGCVTRSACQQAANAFQKP